MGCKRARGYCVESEKAYCEGNLPETREKAARIEATTFEVIVETKEQVELSFSRTWDLSLEGKLAPLSIDKRFHYMAMADNRQRYMPLPDDRLPGRGVELAYPEAVLLVDPVEPEFKGECSLCWDRSGAKIRTRRALEESIWPYLHLLEFIAKGTNPLTLWDDAKTQMLVEVQSWPYSFPASKDFQLSEQRGNISGRLLVQDRYASNDNIPANGAYVGLAIPGDAGSWQRECKDYQFWTKADEEGYFSITNVRTGDYNLYAWVPGFVGDYKNASVITIASGSDTDMGDLVYEPPRDGPTLWEIGIPDRSAAEFYIPDPNPKYINKLFVNHPDSSKNTLLPVALLTSRCAHFVDRFRQYGLWERYSELYPTEDLVYTVGKNDYKRDWFFAQVTRKKDDNTYQGTTWQIKFNLDSVNQTVTYKLRLALASAAQAKLEVRITICPQKVLFSSGLIGGDNAIARHGIHDLYWLYNVDIRGHMLLQGENTIYLTQASSQTPFQGIMYDYIRLEGPPRKAF
ncbi:hypothetical protein RJ639_005679 [Escallonia herrerae]|uniref:Rhamnogalacturonan endolyase n=1 Tax=Escallonia herrerae TaxID=1293975 RepID=A0AA88VYS9_9ASTE|nr:hypothetical protein RJ639_005679 [Escallonia herrerae]